MENYLKKKKKIMAVKLNIVMIILPSIFFQFVSCSMNHTVGGSSGWNLSSNLTLWSSTSLFFVNDSLVFNYTPEHDVIELSKSDYEKCRSNSPISTYDDENGQTVIPLTQPGQRYFICGRANYCSLGMKLGIHVQYQLGPMDQSPQPDTSSDHTSDQPENTLTMDGSTRGDHDKHDPHSSHGYSDLDSVTFSKCLLHLSITLMGIMCTFHLPEGWRLQITGI